jgi:hypothetical protein
MESVTYSEREVGRSVGEEKSEAARDAALDLGAEPAVRHFGRGSRREGDHGIGFQPSPRDFPCSVAAVFLRR